MTDDDRNYLKALDEVRAERDAALARAEAAEARCATLEQENVRLRVENDALVGWQDGVSAGATAAASAADAALSRCATLEDLLGRIFRWDHMDTAADGTYWRSEIAAALAASHPAEEEGT